MTRQQILDAIIPLFHLNQWARSGYSDMSRATSAVYWMKNVVIREALRERLCWAKYVQVERPCKTCGGTGMFKRWLYGIDEDEYIPEDCRRCTATGKVILKFLETTICGVRWHTPRPMTVEWLEASVWDRCESTNWEPEQPGRELSRVALFRLLNEAERAVFGTRTIIPIWSHAMGYLLHFGTVTTCFVCGNEPLVVYFPEVYRPSMQWFQAICECCRDRACRWPLQWPASLFRSTHGRYGDDPNDIDRWKSRVPLPAIAQSEVVAEWLTRRGIAIGKIPPNDYAYLMPEEEFVKVFAHKESKALVTGRHPLQRIVVKGSNLRVYKPRLLTGGGEGEHAL